MYRRKKHGIKASITNRACACQDFNLSDPDINCFENQVFDPVCGCDSITYRNSCVALNYFGITKWSYGPCKFKCKDPGLVDTNKLCFEVYQPVCGCDLITYQNECIAKFKHGISSWTPGECSVNNKDFYHLLHQLYPNPATYSVYLTFTNDRSEEILVEVFTMDAQTVYHKTISLHESIIEIDLQSFSAGLYIYSLTDLKGRKVRGKFLKT